MDKTISPDRKKKLSCFCKNAGISFKNYELLNHAFFHRSSSNEGAKFDDGTVYNNERLEFLGDSVLGMVTASYLFQNLEKFREGDLAKIKSVVVSEKSLAPIGLKLGINDLLVLGHGEEITGGRKKPAILADCMEAVIGAYYLDAGYKSVEKYVLSFIVPEIDKVLVNGTKDYKTQLQELCQKKYRICPIYEVVGTSGPEHQKVFSVVVKIGDRVIGPVNGSSKKEAEQNAAKVALSNE